MADFDPYYQWLAIPPKDQPPNHYRLLGVELFESNADVISNAADQRMTHVRSFQTGKYSALSQKLLNEIAAAKICLLNPAKKDPYDRQLRQKPTTLPPAPPTAPRRQTHDGRSCVPCGADTHSQSHSAGESQAIGRQRPDLAWIGSVRRGGGSSLGPDRGGSREPRRKRRSCVHERIVANSGAADRDEARQSQASGRSCGARQARGTAGKYGRRSAPRSPVVKPAATAVNSTIVNPKNTAVKPTKASGAAGILRSFPEDETKEDDPKEEETKARSPERDHEKVESEAPDNPMPPNETSAAPETVAPPAEKAAVPDEAAQKQALAIIRETYKEDYRASDKAAFAKKLVADGRR